MVPFNFGVCSLWVGLNEWLVKVSRSGELISALWWVELDLFSLECSEVSCSAFWGSRFLAWLWAAYLLMLRAVFLLCWRISLVCLSLVLVGSGVEFDFSVRMEAFG